MGMIYRLGNWVKRIIFVAQLVRAMMALGSHVELIALVNSRL